MTANKKHIANPSPEKVIARTSECMRRLLEAGLTYEDLEIPIDDPGAREKIVGFWKDKGLKPPRAWREQDGVIYFTVTSDGTTGEEWIKRLEDKGFRLNDHAKNVLRSPDFKPTKGITTEIAVLKGELFKKDKDRTTKNIRAEAKKRGLTTPNAEVACLIREKFTDEDIKAMGFWWIVAMHESINVSVGYSYLLGVGRYAYGRWLFAHYGDPGYRWYRDGVFAFAVSSTRSA